MRTIKLFIHPRSIILITLLGIVLSLALGMQQVAAAGTGPCDIYSSGGTPCVAAHSTVRALYGAYSGNLYQVRRSSDNTTTNIGVLSAGGYANAAAQDTFCSGTTCVITIIYDQSGRGNNLTVAPAGGNGSADTPSNATSAQITINGNKAYGVYIAAGNGYRNNATSGVATGDNPEGMYAIFDGTRYNSGCCFDYGNAETNNLDNGNGHMEAIYFGNNKVWGYGSGSGPWVMADLENGLFSGVNTRQNTGDQTVNYRYLTAIVKGGPNLWAIKAGNAQSGGLTTMYSGVRPNASGYNPMHKEGAIILGIGGDNSKVAIGTFYEGAMTSGYPSDATENSVQANVVAAGYGSGSTGPTPTPVPGATTLQAESAVTGGGVSIDTNHTGYNGTGFVNFPTTGGYVQFSNVNGGTGGSHTLTFRFALGVTSARTGQLIVNGVTQSITTSPTGSWNTWVEQTVTVTLNAGTGNTIRIQTNGSDLANLDQMTVN